MDANEAAVILLPSNITVFAFDFSGSGLSDGEYVSLGWQEVFKLVLFFCQRPPSESLSKFLQHNVVDNISGRKMILKLWSLTCGAVNKFPL